MVDADHDQPLGKLAYIVVKDAVCFFEPSVQSAVRMIPPFGSNVEVIEERFGWVLIKWVGKEAWSIREHLERMLVHGRRNLIPDHILWTASGNGFASNHNRVAYGPKGGRFTRSVNGSKRYF